MTCEIMLTVAMGKRLIARGLMADGQVQDAMRNHKLLYNRRQHQRLCGRGSAARAGRRTGVRQEGLSPRRHGCAGRAYAGQALRLRYADRSWQGIYRSRRVCRSARYGRGRHDNEGRKRAVPAGRRGGRAYRPSAGRHGHTHDNRRNRPQGKRCRAHRGLEKRVEEPIAALAAIANSSEADGPRLFPLPGRTFTELDAIAALTGARPKLLAAGGALGAEGCVWLAVSGTDEQIAGVRALVKELSGEPATEL